MTLNELVRLIEQDFPLLISPTKQEVQRIWGYDKDEEIELYGFLEALANIINDEMNQNNLNIDFDKFFELIHHAYMVGDDENKKYIDTSLSTLSPSPSLREGSSLPLWGRVRVGAIKSIIYMFKLRMEFDCLS